MMDLDAPSTASMSRLDTGPLDPSKADPDVSIPIIEGRVDDSDTESEQENEPTEATAAARRRREHQLAFEKLLVERNTDEHNAENSSSLPTFAEKLNGNHVKYTPKESNSIHIRPYQQELYERASRDNVIAVLPTGAGKTLIATLLLKDILRSELEHQDRGESVKTAFFLVDRNFLAKQQYKYICAEIGQSDLITCCTGDDGTDLWSKEQWKMILEKKRIVVSTAEVLNQCMMHGYVKTAEISLLIFDEAHHAKKDHPFARIIKDYYLAEKDLTLRPRIFSMTASPVDAKADVVEAARTLETLLHSQIATSADPSLTAHVPRPTEVEWRYEKLAWPFETELCRRIKAECDIIPLRKNLAFAKKASSELGPTCADMVWDYNFEAEDWGGADMQRRLRWKPSKQARENGKYDEEIRILRRAEEILHSFEAQEKALQTPKLSSKVSLLYENLKEIFSAPTDARCIIFVNQRATALVLRDLFRELRIEYLRPAAFLGNSLGNFGAGDRISAKKQQEMLDNFDNGSLNCLFATSIAEEGLDIRGCNLVVRFDLCTTMIQYLQSRGRARRPDSTFVHMLEYGNQNHRDLIDEAHRSENVLLNFCHALPEDRLLHGCDADIEELVAKDRNHKHFSIQSTGAKLTPRSSLVILENYASSLRHENAAHAKVIYTPKFHNGMFQYMALLPEESPYRGALGDACPRKIFAKQSAAFHTCIQLYQLGLIDDTFQTMFHKRRPVMANAKLAIRGAKKSEYDMQVKPKFWDFDMGTDPEYLFATLLMFVPKEQLSRRHGIILLLTRRPLPKLPPFPVYLEGTVETIVESRPIDIPLKITAEEGLLGLFTSFTLRVYDDLFNKTYEKHEDQMSYWILPARNVETSDIARPKLESLIDFELLQEVCSIGRQNWTPGMDSESWTNRYLVDKWNGKYRYFSVGVEPGLHIHSPLPTTLPARRHRQTILDYTLSLYGAGRDNFKAMADPDQPIINAKLVSLRRNLFEGMNEKELKAMAHDYTVCPQALELSPLPIHVVVSCLAFPTIISRIESYLIALECCDLLELAIGPELALEAMTKDSDNTEEHRAEQIQLQRGMGKNYERLEFIGDTFLKMATSISLFIKFPSESEFDFHVLRMEMICNQNLFDGAVMESRNLPSFIRTEAFNRRTWYSEGLVLIQGKGAAVGKAVKHDARKHALGQKTIADVCEAVIGAAYLTARESNGSMDLAVKAVSKLVNSTNHEMFAWSEYSKCYKLPEYQTAKAGALDQQLYEFVETYLGYCFQYPRLLQSAFTHPSDPWAQVPNYQRLEFLGDSLYDMVCVEYLFKAHPNRDPQWLTEHKMAMVSNKFLAAVAVDLGFDRCLRYHTVAVHEQIRRYSKEVREMLKDGRASVQPDYWTDIEHPPKALSDMVEAYIGAIFIDSDFDYQVVEEFFQKNILWYFQDMTIYDSFANRHPTTYLHTRLTDDFGCMHYRIMASSVNVEEEADRVCAAVIVHHTSIAKAEASSGKVAKVKASEAALRLLQGMSIATFKEQFSCDCHLKRQHEHIEVQADTAI